MIKHKVETPKGKLIIALMYKDSDTLNKAKKALEKEFGSVDNESSEYEFNFTDYYEPEMGKPLFKRFVSFRKLVSREKLSDIRLKTKEIEEKFSKGEKRAINIDPGYITKDSLVIASVKERPHKVYLGKGVFADPNLILKRDGFIELPWTFEDYKIEESQEFFHEARQLLIDQQRKNNVKQEFSRISRLLKSDDDEN